METTASSNYHECLKVCQSYQRRFAPRIHPLSSNDLLQLDRTQYVLIDVRTRPEYTTSRLPNSILWDELLVQPYDSNMSYIFYCTMGYRSGWHALVWQAWHPDACIYNLDGILAFSYNSEKILVLVDDEGGSCRLHTFGPAWKTLPSAEYDATYYRKWQLVLRYVQLGGWIGVQWMRWNYHRVNGYCCRCRWGSRSSDES